MMKIVGMIVVLASVIAGYMLSGALLRRSFSLTRCW